MRLEIIQPEDAEQEDIQHLIRARALEPGKVPMEQLGHMLSSGDAQLWRFVGDKDERGVLVTLIYQREEACELVLWLLAGKGLKPYMSSVLDKLMEFAKLQDCRWMTAVVKPGLARVLTRKARFQETGTRIMMEVQDG